MYGHEVLLCPYKREQSYSGHFSHCYVSDIGLWRLTVYYVEKRCQHGQATSLTSNFDDVNFPVTVANCISHFGSQLNSIRVI
jgi:hypothetical protein